MRQITSFLYLNIHLLSDSVSRSPLYSIYGETIAGVSIIRSFGASSKFLREMLKCVDTVSMAFYFISKRFFFNKNRVIL